MSKAPKICRYCNGTGDSSAGGRCGFCENGKPLDTQEDWDNSWGRTAKFIMDIYEDIKNLSEEDQDKIAALLKEVNRKEEDV